MAVSAVVASTVVSAGSAYMSNKARKEEAARGKRSSKRHARYIAERNAIEQSIARTKYELEVGMEQEQFDLEVDYTLKQLDKKAKTLTSSAIAGYAASGVTVGGEGGSADAVLDFIQSEIQSQKDIFQESKELELNQFIESRGQSLAWFLQQSTLETKYGVQSKLSDAKAYESQAGYANTGMYLGPAAAIGAGVATYSSLPNTTPPPPHSYQASMGPAGLRIE